jgi:DNA-binding NarL/FixJ family response regulator
MVIEKRRVALIIRDEELRERLQGKINDSELYRVTSEAAVFNLASVKDPELFIVDYLPDGYGEGMQVLQTIRRFFESRKILVISSSKDPEVIFACLKGGASGYLLKHEIVEDEIVDRLSELFEGGAPLSTEISKLVVESFHVRNNLRLTPREIKILQLLADGKTYAGISLELDIARETSKKHIKNLYAKLEVHSKDQAIAKGITKKMVYHRSLRMLQ